MSLARQVELMELNKAPPVSGRPAPRGILPAPARPALPAPPLALPAPPPPGHQAGPIDGRPPRRLSQAEQADRRQKGLCYNCDEKYTRGHNRFCWRLFYVDGVTIDEDVEEE
jgi:hypothetical protein